MALQTLPEEMVISPCLLDFLEKALETIPITPVERGYAGLFGFVAPSELKRILFSGDFTSCSVCLAFIVNSCCVYVIVLPANQLWCPRRRTWVILTRWSSWRNPPPPWFPLPRRPTPPSLWTWWSTSESRYCQPHCSSYSFFSLKCLLSRHLQH